MGWRPRRPCLPLWGRCPVRTLGGEGPLRQKSEIFASSPRGSAKLRPVSFLRQRRTADGRPYGVGRTKAFSLRRRWPACGGSDVVSAPSGACPKDKGKRIAPQAFPTVTTPVCGLVRNDGEISIRCRKNDTEQGKAVTTRTAPAHALSVGIAHPHIL